MSRRAERDKRTGDKREREGDGRMGDKRKGKQGGKTDGRAALYMHIGITTCGQCRLSLLHTS